MAAHERSACPPRYAWAMRFEPPKDGEDFMPLALLPPSCDLACYRYRSQQAALIKLLPGV